MKPACLLLGLCFVAGMGCIELTTVINTGTGNGGSGGAAGAGGDGGMGAVGGAGGGMPCVSDVPCNTGMPGACGMGKVACGASMNCVQTTMPSAEVCDTAADESCDGQNSCSGTPTSSFGFGDSLSQGGYDVAVDGKGNVIVTGPLRGTVDFGGGPQTSAGGADIFVVKFDAQGNHVWSRKFGDGVDQNAFAVAVDANDDIYIGGEFRGELTFGNDMLDADDEDAFIAKLDADGNPVWGRYARAGGNQNIYDLATDPEGNVIGVGRITGSADFGGGVVMSGGEDDVLVVKYTSAGNHVWSESYGDISNEETATGVAIDSQSNIYITGLTTVPIDFGTGSLPFGGGADAFLAKFGPQGTPIWSKSFGDGKNQEGVDVAVDINDDVVLTIGYNGSIDLGGGVSLSSDNGGDAAIVKFNSTGAHLWSKRLFMTGGWASVFVDIDGAKNIVATCGYNGTIDFGGGVMIAMGDDLAIAKLDATGKHIWSQRHGSAAVMGPNAHAVGNVGDSWVVGEFSGTVDFGQGPLVSVGSEDMFLTRFAP